MGLAITAHSKVVSIENPELLDDQSVADDIFEVYANHDFPGRANEFENHRFCTGAESFSFGCGAYSSYSKWREQLAKLAGYPKGSSTNSWCDVFEGYAVGAWQSTGGPFWELINFSDCEGVIGTAVSQKLAKDFAEFDERAAAVGECFYAQYQSWRKAFELASDGGLVVFH